MREGREAVRAKIWRASVITTPKRASIKATDTLFCVCGFAPVPRGQRPWIIFKLGIAGGAGWWLEIPVNLCNYIKNYKV